MTLTRGEESALIPDDNPNLIAALRRQWAIIVVCALIGGLAGWYFAASKPTVYESRATLLLIPGGNERSPGGGLNRSLDVETWATVARSTELMRDVAAELDLSLDAVRARSSAAAAATGDILVITFTGSDADAAAAGATIYSSLFLDTRRSVVNSEAVKLSESLTSQRNNLREEIDELSVRISDEEAKGDNASRSQLEILTTTQELAISRLATVESTLGSIDIDVNTGRVLVDPQTVVSETGLSPILTTLTGAFAGLLVGLVLALFRDRNDDRYGSLDSPSVLGVTEIARVPYSEVASRGGSSELNRTIVRLSYARTSESSGKAVLVVAVEGRTLPIDAAHSVAVQLVESGQIGGLAVSAWLQQADRASLDAIRRECSLNDILLVPADPLDRSPMAIGLGSALDETLLLVTSRTPTDLISRAIDDLHGVGARRIQLLVLTGVKRSDRRAAADGMTTSARDVTSETRS